MKILLVVEETFFFHPKFVDGLCKKLKNDIVGVLLVTKIPKKNSLSHYLIKNLKRLYLSEIIILSAIFIIKKIKNLVYANLKIGTPHSVHSVLGKYKKKIIKVENTFDNEKIVNYIINNNIDLILSSNPLYFNKKILNLKNISWLNRHSSYLPFNAGVWPVFYSISKNHKFTGASVHLMNDKIDSGAIIKQEKITLFSKNLYDLYGVCFDKSTLISLESIMEIRKKYKNTNQFNHKRKNNIFYNSFPQIKDWKDFRKNGGIFVKWKNLFETIFGSF